MKEMHSTHAQLNKEEILAILDPILKTHFRPELLNRLDDILPFLPLRKEDMAKIAAIQLHKLQGRLKERHVVLKWDEKLLAYLAEAGYDPFFGARPLKRLIQQEVSNILATGILKGDIPGDCTVRLTLKEDKPAYEVVK
jgi:ATP-dependent Clp protease ATP-binding subunit ClpB